MLLSGLEDGLDSYVPPLAILIVKGVQLALGLLYLGSLHVRVDEYVNNVVQSVGR